MKKLIINLTLILGFSLFTGGCDFELDLTPDPPSSWHKVSGVFSDRNSGKLLGGVKVLALDYCRYCPEDDSSCSVNYASGVVTKEDGTFSFTYYGHPRIWFKYDYPSDYAYNFISINGKEMHPLACLTVGDSVFLDVKIW